MSKKAEHLPGPGVYGCYCIHLDDDDLEERAAEIAQLKKAGKGALCGKELWLMEDVVWE